MVEESRLIKKVPPLSLESGILASIRAHQTQMSSGPAGRRNERMVRTGTQWSVSAISMELEVRYGRSRSMV